MKIWNLLVEEDKKDFEGEKGKRTWRSFLTKEENKRETKKREELGIWQWIQNIFYDLTSSIDVPAFVPAFVFTFASAFVSAFVSEFTQ